MIKRSLKWLGIILLSLAGVGLFIKTIISQNTAELWHSLVTFGIWGFIGFVVISMVNFGLYVERWRLIINHMAGQDKVIGFWRLYAHRMAGYTFSYLIPSAQTGGEPVRVGLLVKDGVKSEQAVASVTLDIAIELTFFGGFVFLGFIFSMLQGVTKFSSSYMSLVFILCFFGFFLAIWLAIWRGYRPFEAMLQRQVKTHAWTKVLKFLAETEKTISDFFAAQRLVTVKVMFLSVLTMLFRVVEVYYIATIFGGATLEFSQAFLIATLPGIALLVPIPAGLGVFEGGYQLIFGLLGVRISSLAFVTIIRGRDLVFVALGLLHTFTAARGAWRPMLKEKYDR